MTPTRPATASGTACSSQDDLAKQLLPGMAAALDADRATELHRALDAVVDIAIDRHAKLSP